MTTSESEKPKLGGSLTAWLLLIILVNSLMSLGYFYVWFSSNDVRIYQQTGIPWILFCVFSLLSAGNVVGAFAIGKWRYWGFQLILWVTGAAVILNLLSGAPLYLALLGIVGPIILWFLLRSKRQHFKDSVFYIPHPRS